MEPELIRDILLKSNVFQKPPPHPLGKLLVSGLVTLEGERWAKRRKNINPAFHLEKLKVILNAQLPNQNILPYFRVFFFFNLFTNSESEQTF